METKSSWNGSLMGAYCTHTLSETHRTHLLGYVIAAFPVVPQDRRPDLKPNPPGYPPASCHIRAAHWATHTLEALWAIEPRWTLLHSWCKACFKIHRTECDRLWLSPHLLTRYFFWGARGAKFTQNTHSSQMYHALTATCPVTHSFQPNT